MSAPWGVLWLPLRRCRCGAGSLRVTTLLGSQLLWSTALKVLSPPENVALIGWQTTVAEADQAGLASPASSQQNGGLAATNSEIERLEPAGQSSPAELQNRHQRILPS